LASEALSDNQGTALLQHGRGRASGTQRRHRRSAKEDNTNVWGRLARHSRRDQQSLAGNGRLALLTAPLLPLWLWHGYQARPRSDGGRMPGIVFRARAVTPQHSGPPLQLANQHDAITRTRISASKKTQAGRPTRAHALFPSGKL
jgi:hypothetical protein